MIHVNCQADIVKFLHIETLLTDSVGKGVDCLTSKRGARFFIVMGIALQLELQEKSL